MAVLSANFENHDTFARLGVDDLNDNFWWKLDGVDYLAGKATKVLFESENVFFSDRHVSLERHDSKGDVQTTLKIYTGIHDNLYVRGYFLLKLSIACVFRRLACRKFASLSVRAEAKFSKSSARCRSRTKCRSSPTTRERNQYPIK